MNGLAPRWVLELGGVLLITWVIVVWQLADDIKRDNVLGNTELQHARVVGVENTHRYCRGGDKMLVRVSWPGGEGGYRQCSSNGWVPPGHGESVDVWAAPGNGSVTLSSPRDDRLAIALVPVMAVCLIVVVPRATAWTRSRRR